MHEVRGCSPDTDSLVLLGLLPVATSLAGGLIVWTVNLPSSKSSRIPRVSLFWQLFLALRGLRCASRPRASRMDFIQLFI